MKVRVRKLRVEDVQKRCGYVLGRKLGAGSYGDVWEVHREGNEQEKWAMKVERSKTRSKPNYITAESLLEAMINKTIRHPNLVTAHTVQFDEEHDGAIVMVCERAAQTLDRYLHLEKSNTEPDWRELVRRVGWIENLWAGLRHLHVNQIAHFDIKPENVLLFAQPSGPRRWVAKLSDHGLAERIAAIEPDQPIGGTMHYRAPEILAPASHSRQHAFAMDRWSLGILAWRLFFGVHPFITRQELRDTNRERDMLHFIYRRLGTPPLAWVSRNVRTSSTISTAASFRGCPGPAPCDFGVLVEQQSLKPLAFWAKRYSVDVLKELLLFFERVFRYDPESRVVNLDALVALTNLKKLQTNSVLPVRQILDLDCAPALLAQNPWLASLQPRIPTPLFRNVFALWTKLRLRRTPIPLEEAAILSLATKMAGYKDDRYFFRAAKVVFKSSWELVYKLQHEMIAALEFSLPFASVEEAVALLTSPTKRPVTIGRLPSVREETKSSHATSRTRHDLRRVVKK